jgi:hypothetical protein
MVGNATRAAIISNLRITGLAADVIAELVVGTPRGGQVSRRRDELVRSRFQFIDDHRDTYEGKRLCQVLDVEPSSYYKWSPRPEGEVADLFQRDFTAIEPGRNRARPSWVKCISTFTASGRNGSMLPFLALRTFKALQAKEKLVLGEAYSDSGYVVVHETGEAFTIKQLRRRAHGGPWSAQSTSLRRSYLLPHFPCQQRRAGSHPRPVGRAYEREDHEEVVREARRGRPPRSRHHMGWPPW